MKLDVLNLDGSKNSTVTLDDAVFGIKPNHHVVHQAVTSELSNSRQGTHSSKNRSMNVFSNRSLTFRVPAESCSAFAVSS